MVGEAEAAVEAIEFARAEPRGIIKASCPVALVQTVLAGVLPDFLHRYPNIRLVLHASNRRVDLLNEGFDLAIRVRSKPTGEHGIVMRTIGQSRGVLVASPAYLDGAGRLTAPAQLAERATLALEPEADRQSWEVFDPNGASVRVEVTPRLVCHDFVML